MEINTNANMQNNYSCSSNASTSSTASTTSDCSERNSADTSQRTRPLHQRTQAQKKMDRVLANRRSAQRSRERKKQLQENLQLSVAVLSKRNEDLTQENHLLKQKLEVLSGLANQLTQQRQKTVASDKLLLTLLLQQMQPTAPVNFVNKGFNTSPAPLM